MGLATIIYHPEPPGVEGVQRTMYALANCILCEDFGGQHNEFVGALYHSVMRLHENSFKLTVTCSHASADGVITDDEAEEIEALQERVRECQRELLHKFRQAVPSGISASLAEEITFLFALSFWATTTENLATELVTHEPSRSWYTVIKQGFVDTWGLHHVLEPDHLKFVVRNFIPISTCYILAYAVPTNSVFVQYSATMPNTLASSWLHQFPTCCFLSLIPCE